MRKGVILHGAYPHRMQALEFLLDIAESKAADFAHVARLAANLDEVSARTDRAEPAVAYSAFAGLLRIIATLVEWRQAVLDAQMDADRLLRSAKERYRLWQSEYAPQPAAQRLVAASLQILEVTELSQVSEAAGALAATPLPLGVFETSGRRIPLNSTSKPSQAEEAPPPELHVAFLKFHWDGQPAADVHSLAPKEVHDLEVEVRVSRWPESATHLVLTPVSAEPKSAYDFPVFRFERPASRPPFTLTGTERALLHVSQGSRARPFEFKYAASFEPRAAEQPVAVVGHRTLLVEGLDLAKTPLSGYPSIDRKVLAIRDAIRSVGGAPHDDLGSAVTLLAGLANAAGRAVQDAEYKGRWREAEFQKSLKADLRRIPSIGVELDEHSSAAGGFNDLNFRGIPLELKVCEGQVQAVEDCQRYVEQAASYAVAKGKRLALLGVLDSSPKQTAPRLPEDLIGVLTSANGDIAVITVVLQGNLSLPSALSR